MSAKVISQLEQLAQELAGIRNTCEDACTYAAEAWQGEASRVYLGFLRESGENALSAVNLIEGLKEKVTAFASAMELTQADA